MAEILEKIVDFNAEEINCRYNYFSSMISPWFIVHLRHWNYGIGNVIIIYFVWDLPSIQKLFGYFTRLDIDS